MKNRLLITLIICTTFFTAGCGNKSFMEVPELLTPVGKSISEVNVTRKTLYSTEVYNGEVVPEIVEYAFPERGRLTALYVEIGDKVNEGNVLAEIDDTSIRAKISSIQDEIRELDGTYGYTIRSLEAENAKPETTWQQREMNELIIRQSREVMDKKLVSLNAQLEEANDRLVHTELKCKVAGDVIAVAGSVGRTAYAGTPVVAVANPEKSFVISKYIDEEIREEAHLIYTMVAGKVVPLTFLKNEPADNPEYSYFTVPDSYELGIGEYAPVVVVSDYHENVVAVSKDCVYKDDGGSYVYVVADGTRNKKYVSLGYVGLNEYEVLDGLSESDRVFVKDDSTTNTESLQTIRGDFVLTTRAKASAKYTQTTNLNVTQTYGTLIFKQFEVNSFVPVKKGDVLASYYETVDQNYMAEVEFALEYALRDRNAEEIGRLENLLEDLKEACTNRVVVAPFDGMINSMERIFKGSGIPNGRIGTFVSTKNMLLTVDNSSNSYRYGQTVTVEATLDGKTVLEQVRCFLRQLQDLHRISTPLQL